jgi:hypothetical protein
VLQSQITSQDVYIQLGNLFLPALRDTSDFETNAILIVM